MLLCAATEWMWLATGHVSPALAAAWTALSYVAMSKLVAVRRARWTDRHALYRFWAHPDLPGRRPLYIGITSSPELRFAQHRASKDWWDEVMVREVHYYPTRQLLAAAEKAAIIRERPVHNKIHNGRAA